MPPPSTAVVLFSDCQFELPAVAPPTYVVADARLDSPADAMVNRLEVREGSLAASVINHSSSERDLVFTGTVGGPTTRISAGSLLIERKLAGAGAEASARLGRGDAWPENDGLWIQIPPAASSERWWVGASPAGDKWRAFAPDKLPLDPADYLAPSVIVLDNVPATDLPRPQQRRLQQYVRDLGGTLIILGGDHAFAAGNYPGSLLESLSPLSSFPPAPTTHWILLADSSGSMSADAAGTGLTQWEIEKRAF